MGSINRFTGFISINLGLVFKKKTWACFVVVVLMQFFLFWLFCVKF